MERIIGTRKQGGLCLVTGESGRQFAYPLAMRALFPVREGDEADLDDLERELRRRARPYAMARLAQLQAGRDHTRKELLEALRRQGYPEECAGEAVEEMCAAGLAGDERYCESLIRSRARKEGRGLLERKMRAQGADDETVRQALDDFLDPEEEERAAVAQAEKLRARGVEEQKIFLRLSRKGYSRSLCLKAVRETGEGAP